MAENNFSINKAQPLGIHEEKDNIDLEVEMNKSHISIGQSQMSINTKNRLKKSKKKLDLSSNSIRTNNKNK